jgi:hypothetical protein
MVTVMADEITPPVSGATPPTDGGVTPPIDASNLPSMQQEFQEAMGKFTITDEFAQANFKNGKLYGRFDSIEAVLNTLHDVETKYSNVMRDIKSAPPASAPNPPAPEVPITEIAQPIIKKYIDNNFNYDGMDAEIAQLSQETGKSVAEIKLAAIEARELVTKAHSIVGGKSNYDAMIQWGMANLNDSQKSDFDKALNSGMGEYAIKGLYNDYQTAQQASGNSQPSRIEGDGSGSMGIKPYGTFKELADDRAYLSGKGRNDTAAHAIHKQRMMITPDNVVYGR